MNPNKQTCDYFNNYISSFCQWKNRHTTNIVRFFRCGGGGGDDIINSIYVVNKTNPDYMIDKTNHGFGPNEINAIIKLSPSCVERNTTISETADDPVGSRRRNSGGNNIDNFNHNRQKQCDVVVEHEHILYIATDYAKMNEHFFIINLGVVESQYNRWVKNMPYITPHYAIKSNPDPQIIARLNELGCHFDVASKKEIQIVMDCGVSPDKIIYANPCKSNDHIQYANNTNVNLLVVDCLSEIDKIYKFHPTANIVVRIKVDDSFSVCKFNTKYGINIEDTEDLFINAFHYGLNVVGVSFHVGSSCKNKNVFATAIENCKRVIDIGREYGFEMNIVDIGGGFPGNANDQDNSGDNIDEFAKVINASIESNFNGDEYKNIKFIAEPGRYFSSASHTLFSSVIGRKMNIDSYTGELTMVYYINDGVYGVFSGIMFDYAKYNFDVLKKDTKGGGFAMGYNTPTTQLFNTIIFGPSCDSLDMVCKDVKMQMMELGDYVVVRNIGDYSVASAVEFNGFPLPVKIYLKGNTQFPLLPPGVSVSNI
jgi:ornithine decarboxylase